MHLRRLVILLLIMGLFTLICGCASHRTRVMKADAVPDGGSPHIKGPLARVHMHGNVDCWDIFVMVVLFTWLFGD